MPSIRPTGLLSAAGCLVVALALPSPGPAEPPGDRPAAEKDGQVADAHPELKRLSPTDAIWIDLPRRRVVVGGEVVLDRGQIEFFACPRKTKEHESIVAVDASARLVHAGLLAIGLVPGKPVAFDPIYAAATGPVVRITMRWTDEAGVTHSRDAREWIRDTRSGRSMEPDWVFAGSGFWKDPDTGEEFYHGDGGDLVCVSNFPTATLDLPIPSSQSNEALIFEVFQQRVPRQGTRVEMILEPAGDD